MKRVVTEETLEIFKSDMKKVGMDLSDLTVDKLNQMDAENPDISPSLEGVIEVMDSKLSSALNDAIDLCVTVYGDKISGPNIVRAMQVSIIHVVQMYVDIIKDSEEDLVLFKVMLERGISSVLEKGSDK